MGMFRIAGLAALAWATPLLAQTGAAPAPAAPPPPAKAPKAAGRGLRILKPESIAAELMRATPEQRERALAALPPARQEQIRKQLAWFDGLPKAEQDIQLRRLERFASLPPDQQVIVRLQVQAMGKLAPARRQAIQRALVMLQTLPMPQRAARMNNPAFQGRFSPEERKIIEELASAWLLPAPQPVSIPPN